MNPFREDNYTKWWNQKRAIIFAVTRWNKTLRAKIHKFDGIQTIAWINIKEGMKIHYQMDLQEGEAKLLLIHKKNWILISDCSCQGVTSSLNPGMYRLRVVGNHASLTCTIQKNAQHI